MAQHKWHNEIHAFAEGEEIETNFYEKNRGYSGWQTDDNPDWHDPDNEHRIKPQPKEQDSFKAMCEIPYKQWVLRFYQMPNDLWYSEGMDDAWMKEMVEASKPQPKEPQYLYVYQGRTDVWLSLQPLDTSNYIGKIKLEDEDV